MTRWTFILAERSYEYAGADGSIVRCNADDFESIAKECEEAGITLSPSQALAEGWAGFYVAKEADEPEKLTQGAVDMLHGKQKRGEI